MRKLLTNLSLLFFTSSLFAQQWDGSATTSSRIYRYGDISTHFGTAFRTTIGAAWGAAAIGYGTGYLGFNLARNNHSDGLWTYTGDGANNGGNVIYGDAAGNLMFSNFITTGSSSGTLTDNDIVNNIRMRIRNDGKVIIGNVGNIQTPSTYKLYVENGILTERVKVAIKTSGDWADHVFTKQYRLMPLSELEQYVSINRHLPGIPSADSMVVNGNDLGKTDAKLLEKIEELTLYVLQLNKEKEKLQLQVNTLQKQAEGKTPNQDSEALTQLQHQVAEMQKQLEKLSNK